jgi:CxxC motif-containing protein (DUF1111 family)
VSYNALRVTCAGLLAGIANGAVLCLSGTASAQTATVTVTTTPARAATSSASSSAATVCLSEIASTTAQVCTSATDPGPRPLTAAQAAFNTPVLNSTGSYTKSAPSLSGFPGITFDAPVANYFAQNTVRFQEVDSISGGITSPFPETGSGLGPTFNSNSCASCHVYPILGGGSPPGNFTTTDRGGRTFTGNPQVTVANIDGATNVVPSFITQNGPIREARFINVPGTNTPDGGVHDLFVTTGRTDNPSVCTITQPNFAQALAQNNVIFRIPITVNGDGLVEVIPDGDQNTAVGLTGAVNLQASFQSSLGIAGVFNRSANDGTITKFGWKAQNKSLLLFAGEAYNVEQGVTNELFTNGRNDTAGCNPNPLPEDQTNTVNTINSGSPASDYSSDITNFAAFMRLSGPPLPVTPFTASQSAGETVFLNIGCGACHIQSQTTAGISFANSNQTVEGAVTFQPFSDFQLHNMGFVLADGVSQGNADGQQFRSAPLWGLGQRVFFLHDGRTNSLPLAILEHFSIPATADGLAASEANQVIANFVALSAVNQQNLINFLRGL